MKIEQIQIERFAGLRDVSLSFGDGLSLIEGENESGKSSIGAFIKFMLYGMSGRPTGGQTLSERRQHLPYRESHVGGSMDVEKAGRRYRISRNLSVGGTSGRETVQDRVKVTDLWTGEEVFRGSEPGVSLLGIPEEVFVNCVYLRQAADKRVDGAGIGEAITNILFSGDETIHAKKALERLDAVRTPLFRKNGTGGKIEDLRGKVRELDRAIDAAKKENETFFEKEASLAARKSSCEKHKENLRRIECQRQAYDTACLIRDAGMTEEAERAEYDAYEALMTFRAEAHIPTDEEMDALRVSQKTLIRLREQETRQDAAEASLRLREAEHREESELVRRVDDAGGADAVRGGFASLEKRRTGCLTAGVVMLIAAVLCGAAAILSFFDLPLPLPVHFGWIAAGIGIGCLFSSVVLLLLSGKAGREKKRLAGTLGMREGETPDGLIRRADDAREETQRLTEQRLALSETVKLTREAMAAERATYDDLLRELDVPTKEEADAGTEIPFEEAVKRLEDRRKKDAALSATELSTRTARDTLRSRVSGVDIAALLEQLAGYDIEDPLSADPVRLSENARFYRSQLEMQEKEVRELECELAALRVGKRSPAQLSEEREAVLSELREAERTCDACLLAYDCISRAMEEQRKSVAPTLEREASASMRRLTDGNHESFSVSPSLGLSFRAEGEDRDVSYLSTGTQDLAYLSLRLALSGLLGRHELPVIFDEACAYLDDRRASAFLRLLSEKAAEGQQFLLFTCHHREETLCRDSGVPVHILSLSGEQCEQSQT